MKRLGLALCLGTMSLMASAQNINVTYKPNATIGQDALLWQLTTGTGSGVKPCIPSTQTTTPATTNYPNDQIGTFSAWTWAALGCPNGITRMLIRFPQLDIIPMGGGATTGPNQAVINNATLILHGIPPTTGYYGNSYYPGTATPLPNLGYIYRVAPGANNVGSPNNWKENVVTWNTQPAVDPNLAPVTIPITSAQWNYDLAVDVTPLVQQIFNEVAGFSLLTPPYYVFPDSFANNGFLLKLQNEVAYRQQDYATSDNLNAALWPELKIEYSLPYPCNGSFSYTNDPLSPLNFKFTADNQTFLSTGGQYNWYIDGNDTTSVGQLPTLDWHFTTPGNHRVQLSAKYHPNDDICGRIARFNIAINDGSVVQSPTKASLSDNNLLPNPDLNSTGNVNFIPPGDDPLEIVANKDVTISPNPTEEDWAVNIFVRQETSANVNMYDITGKKLKGDVRLLKAGFNSFKQSASDLAPGIYIMEITGELLNFRQKLSKK